MNSPIRRLASLVLIMFGILLLSATYLQYFAADDLRKRPDNRRTLLAGYDRQRGPIIIGGKPVALSKPSSDQFKYQRTYPDSKLYAHLTGYFSFVYGAGAGVERGENSLLAGSTDQFFYRRVMDVLTSREPQGASIELTIDPAAQKAADAALGDQRGAVVALNPKTGAILALVSHPSYDPNLIASHDLQKSTESYRALLSASGDPLVNKALAGDLYPPGSTFKIVTAAAALSTGKYNENSQVYGGALLDLPQSTATLPNDFSGACGPGDRVSITRALQISCNTAFGSLGIALGGEALRAQAAKFGFGDKLTVPMSVTPSVVPADLNAPQAAQSAIGQYDVRVTPLQMAMVSAGVANGGIVMKPYSVKTVRAPDLTVISTTAPQELSRAVEPSVAAQLNRMMQAVVADGSGRYAKIDGVKVAGKTGTAQQGNDKPPHAWFTAFAPADSPEIAIAVVVEGGSASGSQTSGSRVAAPIAKAVMTAVLK